MGGKLLNKLLAYFIGANNMGLLEEIKPMRDRYNYKSLRFSTISFLPFLVILTVASIIVPKMRWMFWGLVFYTFVMVILFVLSRLDLLQKHNKLNLILLYVEIFFTLTFALLISNFADPKIVSVAYHVFLVALPLFVCDLPWRLGFMYLVLMVPFLLTSYYVKESKIFVYDMANCFIYTILGICVNIGVQINHFESFTNRCIIKRQRDTDNLTGAYTKKAFEIRVLEEMRRPNSTGIFMMFDIDNFKTINDTLGHAIGDYFISNTGHLILNNCRQTDIVGRFGGDEFIIYMPNCDSEALINKKAKELMNALKEYFSKNMNYENFSISIGSTIYNNPTKTYKEIFNEIDTALYDAKKSGKNKCCIYRQPEK